MDRSAQAQHSTDAIASHPPISSQAGIVGELRDLAGLLADHQPDDPSEIAGQVTVAESPQMDRIVEQARRFAASSATVLITGESGTGKELIARIIHQHGPRRSFPYVRINCAAIPESLMESELFGHEKGAFTGAVDSRQGRLEAAARGTLLLDEISEIPVNLQAKMLRVLEEEEFQRVGGNQTLKVQTRIVATSNRQLSQFVESGHFRQDLFYRLNVLHLNLPPLRQRRADISPLAQHFFERFRHESQIPLKGFSPAAWNLILESDWPGNVRQLRNSIHSACVVCSRPWIDVDDLPYVESAASDELPLSWRNLPLAEIERLVIEDCLRRYSYNKQATAQHLGITARTIFNKLKKYNQPAITLPMTRAA